MTRLPATRAAARAAVLLALSVLAACQTTAPAPTAPAPTMAADPPGKAIRAGKGWAVTLHRPDGAKPYCRAVRSGGSGAQLAFRTGPAEASLTLVGSGASVNPGQTYELTATFDHGGRETLKALGQPDGSLKVAVPPANYLDDLESFARAKRVTFRCPELGGDFVSLPLTGSAWAINASDECRILNAEG